MTELREAFPWKQPDHSIYGSDGPLDGPVEFEIGGVKMRVEVTDALAPNTLRDRFKVSCLTCDKVIHRATTGASTRCEQHLEDDHGIKELP